MEKRTGLVHEPEKAQTNLKAEFSKREHERAMTKGHDVPETPPPVPIPIGQVGIGDKTVWIALPQGRIPFSAEISVDLSPHYKGIHMSRIERSISDLYESAFEDPIHYADILAEMVLDGQRANRSLVELSGRMPQLTRTPVSRQVSSDSVEVRCAVTACRTGEATEKIYSAGVGVCHITACPCTQAYNEILLRSSSRDAPQPTHSQRCLTWLDIETADSPVRISKVYECLSSCLHLCQDLLKRPDEAELVWHCHSRPQFAEDVVRVVARQAGSIFGNELPADSLVRIHSTSFESIHLHTVWCRLETTIEEITSVRAT